MNDWLRRQTIWKFKLPMTLKFSIEIPANAQFIHAEVISHTLYLWAIVDPEDLKVPFHFSLVPTGGAAPFLLASDHIATLMFFDRAEVYHLFRRRPGQDPE